MNKKNEVKTFQSILIAINHKTTFGYKNESCISIILNANLRTIKI